MAQPGFRLVLDSNTADRIQSGYEIEENVVIYPKKGDWVICIHCWRAYPIGNYSLDPEEKPLRIKKEIFPVTQYCPLPDCDGSADSDAMLWEHFLEQTKDKNFPKIPEAGKEYYPYK